MAKEKLRGKDRERVLGLLRHTQMVMRQDNRNLEYNGSNPDKTQRPIFTSDDDIAGALEIIESQCQILLFGA